MSERPAPGSLRYFAVLFAAPPARASLEAVYAFEAELRRIVVGSSHEAAHARLGWWRSELDRLAAGRPTHPTAAAMLPLRRHPGLDLTLLHEMLTAADLDVVRITYLTWTELEAYCFRAAGVPQTLLAAALADHAVPSAAERDFARRLGSAVRQVEMLRDLHFDIAAGRLYAPLEALDAAGVDPSGLARDIASAAARQLVAEWSERVRKELESLPALLADPVERARQRHGLVLGALHGRLLEQVSRVPAAPPARAALGPFDRLWTAWRTARRYA